MSDDIAGPGHLTFWPAPEDAEVGLWSNSNKSCEKVPLSLLIPFLFSFHFSRRPSHLGLLPRPEEPWGGRLGQLHSGHWDKYPSLARSPILWLVSNRGFMFSVLSLNVEGNKWSPPLVQGKSVPAQSSLLGYEFKAPPNHGNNS